MTRVKWVEISERLPTEEEIVWVTAFGWTEVCIFRGGAFRAIELGTHCQNVTAWAPMVLPDPYGGKNLPNYDAKRPEVVMV